MQFQSKNLVFQILLGTLAFVAVFTAVTAFSGPSTDPSGSEFSSQCALALSKDGDLCEYNRAYDSLEAIRDKIDTLIPS